LPAGRILSRLCRSQLGDYPLKYGYGSLKVFRISNELPVVKPEAGKVLYLFHLRDPADEAVIQLPYQAHHGVLLLLLLTPITILEPASHFLTNRLSAPAGPAGRKEGAPRLRLRLEQGVVRRPYVPKFFRVDDYLDVFVGFRDVLRMDAVRSLERCL